MHLLTLALMAMWLTQMALRRVTRLERIGKDMEGSDYGSLEVVSRQLHGGYEEYHEELYSR